MKDEKWLQTQFPFPLIPTNIEGVYTTLPLPDDLDLKTASDATLLRHGLLLRRPRAGDHPLIAAAWNEILGRGLRSIAPHVEPQRDKIRRVKWPQPRGGTGSGTATSTNWCGCALQGPGNWRSVGGLLTLPYVSVPPQGLLGNPPSGLSAWVGLDGWIPGSNELFQAVILFGLDQSTNPASTYFSYPNWQWWYPDPTNPSEQLGTSGQIANAPNMQSGDSVQFYIGYVDALDGSKWGTVQFVFYSDLESVVVPRPVSSKWPPRTAEIPTFIDLFFQAPGGASCPGATIEWIMENESVTMNPSIPTTMPVFSSSQQSITPLTFAQALGYNQAPGIYADPANGTVINFANSTVTKVTVSSGTVSIAYV
jgi:hypothetical protein